MDPKTTPTPDANSDQGNPPETPVNSLNTRNLPQAIAGAFQSGIDIGRGFPVTIPDQDGHVLIPSGFRKEEVSIPDARLPRPRRLRQAHAVYNVKDAIDYVNRYKSGTSLILISPEPTNGQPCARIILDYHENPLTPAWGEHVVDLIFRTSWQFDAITALTKQLIPQDAFALGLRDIAGFCRTVQAADLLEIARTLSLTVKGNFRNYVDEFNGSVDFTYNMQVTGQAGTSARELKIPQYLDWDVPILLGGDKQLVQTDFVYSIPKEEGEKVRMGLRMHGRGEMLLTLGESIRVALVEGTGLLALTAKF